MMLKDLKKGDYFTIKPIETPTEKQVYIKGDYDRASKNYECTRFDDICESRSFSGNRTVYTDFTF